MRYLSVCSGIEAASVAWHPLGWTPAAFAEIDAFPSAVLAHHWPDVPNLGDFTKIGASDVGPVQLIVGGTPCQSFSVAGLRKGLDDPRGNLALAFLRLADLARPRWLVWENVPGVLSSSDGRDFGAFLGGLAELGYGWAYRVLDAQYIRVDGYARAVPQRRRRVFVVGCLGDWRGAAAVLFERESLSGHPAPRREAGKGIAHGVACGFDVGGTLGPRVSRLATDECAQGSAVIADTFPRESARARNAHGVRIDAESETFVAVAPTIRAGGNRTGGHRPPGTDVDTCDSLLAIAIQERAICENPDAGPDGAGVRTDGAAYTLESRTVPQAVAFTCKDHGADAGDIAPTLRGMGHDASHANGGGQVAVAFPSHFSNHNVETTGISPTLTIGSGLEMTSPPAVLYRAAVRRLTPRECERLQGFHDDYTLITRNGKPAADGPRYKALGNSMAVNAMRWIGMRIALVDEVLESEAAA